MFFFNKFIEYRCPSQPTVNECSEGDYSYKRGFLVWDISMISPESKTPTIDFDLSSSTTASVEDFFPINCTFNSEQNLAGLIVSCLLRLMFNQNIVAFISNLQIIIIIAPVQ